MKPEIRSLTGLRGIAATLVMLDHYAAVDFSSPFPLTMLPHMYLAVDMFMILSGFILAMTYEDRLKSLPAGAGYKLFLLRRIARLYPLYALTTVVCFALCRAGLLTFLNPNTSLGALLSNLLALQTWTWPGSSLDGPAWSISAEWFANLLFPLLMPVIVGRSLMLATSITGVAFLALIFSALMFGQLFDVPSAGAVNIISGPESLGRCLSEFVIGLYCWRLRSRLPRARHLAGNLVQFAMLAALLVLMQFTALDSVFVAVCALLVVGLSYDKSFAAAVLRCAPLLYLGRISYSIYLVHITLLPARDRLFEVFGGQARPNAWIYAVLCSAAAAITLAALSWRYVERPGQAYLLDLLCVRAVRKVH